MKHDTVMRRQSLAMPLTRQALTTLRDNAHRTLEELVTTEGIYASTSKGWRGPYHGWFGRDSAIVCDFLLASLRYGGDLVLADRSYRGLLALAAWQGRVDNPATGEEAGKLPHEIRNVFDDVHGVQHAAGTNQKPWFIDPADGYLKNWDSADSTLLWVMAITRAHQQLALPYDRSVSEVLRRALIWIVDATSHESGLIGFTGADLQPQREYSGLHNQGWKDSYQVYQQANKLAPHPIKDILVNAEAWAALLRGSDVFADSDPRFAQCLRKAAARLKRRFNGKKGFALSDGYFAQAIDGQGVALPQASADVALCLWPVVRSETVFHKDAIARVVATITSSRFLNPAAGIRNYALGTTFTQGTRYHGSDATYWPFVSGLTVQGLVAAGYADDARLVAEAFLRAIDYFGSNIEMFVEQPTPPYLLAWHHPQVGQQSAIEQAWTAAAVYYASLFLLRDMS